MTTESSLDRYDEVLILARDARLRRRWTQRVTTGLIVGAMGLNFAYVFAISKELQTAKQQADDRADEILQLERERDRYMVLSSIYERRGDALVAVAPTLELGSSLEDLGSSVTDLGDRLLKYLAGRDERRPIDGQVLTSEIHDMIWLVDGSRRVPMTANDILWIPQMRSHVELQRLDSRDVTFEIRSDERQSGQTTPRQPRQVTLDMTSGEVETTRITTTEDDGNTNCVTIAPLGPSTRVPMQGFIDVDVRFETCREP